MMGWKAVGLLMSIIFLAISVVLSALIWAGHSSMTEAKTTPPAVFTTPVVSTPIGRFVGVVRTSETYGSTYISYRSIQFAKPPIGDLRFRRPQPLDNVTPTRQVNSDQYQKSCLSATQLNADPYYGEDCLYLNVYVPGSRQTARNARNLPVMIWIHGGGFVAGSTFPEPEKLVLSGNVIVVTINYRLGVFGFLTTKDDELASNNGLWDQYMALKWVNSYIHYFEGDNTSITIFGNSAGAVSAALHTISPVSSGLFHKAILQSGGATSLLSRDAEIRAKELAFNIGCLNPISTYDLGKCLRQASATEILQHSRPTSFNISSAQQQIDFIWMPIVDGIFIPDEPLALLRNITYMKQIGAFAKDFLIGVLNNDGALIAQNFLNPVPLSQLANAGFFEDLTEHLLYGRYGPDAITSHDLKEAIYYFYTGSENSSPRPEEVMDLAGDLVFIVPAIEMAISLSNCRETVLPSCFVPSQETKLANCAVSTSKIFFYHLDYCPETDQCNAQCMTHGSDVAYEFPRTAFTDPVRQQVSDIFVDLLSAFAWSSDPGTVVASGWPEFDMRTQRYLNIDYIPSVRQHLYNYRVNFWLDTVPRLVKYST